MRPARLFILLVLALLHPGWASGQPIEEVRVHFDKGSSGTTIDDRLKGYETVDYLLAARAGQAISIHLRSSNLSGYFNLLPGNSQNAIHTGSVDGNDYAGALPADGDYRIRVYLMRNAARRGETMDYSLSVSIKSGAPGAAPADPDYADGLSGGPDYWQVANVPRGDTLNVRSGPGTGHRVVGELANGDRARNMGCKMVGNARWCLIEAGGEQSFTGWVNGRYLVEASGAPHSDATGTIPCAPQAGQPTRNCPFRVSRGGNGSASVWITLPAGGERYLEFVDGNPVLSDAGLSVGFEKIADLYLVRIDGSERYEIPEAVVYGG